MRACWGSVLLPCDVTRVGRCEVRVDQGRTPSPALRVWLGGGCVARDPIRCCAVRVPPGDEGVLCDVLLCCRQAPACNILSMLLRTCSGG
jgi:hypothetical protein